MLTLALAPEITSERVDDLPLLVHQLRKMEVDRSIDETLPPPHGNRQGLSFGQLAVGFLSYILTECDHRLSPVEEWTQARQESLSLALGAPVGPKDFTDDRLEDLLAALGDEATRPWEALEERLGQHLIRAYALPTQTGRLDTTSVSVYHQPPPAQEADSLLRFGHSKDGRPDLRQFIQLLGTLDPAGIPWVTETLPGHRADDRLYLPAWRRMGEVLGRADFLLVADCKFSSLANRAQVHSGGGFYLAPLPATGERPERLRAWVLSPPCPIQELWLEGQPEEASGQEPAPFAGFEVVRELSWRDPRTGETLQWEERGLVLRSRAQAEGQLKGLHARLAKAEAALEKLARRPGSDPEALEQKVQALLSHHRVRAFLAVEITEQVAKERHYLGRGRPGPKRPSQEVEKRTLHLSFRRKVEAIEEGETLAGWRVYVTNAPAGRLSLSQAVSSYKGQWQPERGFQRLKDRPLAVASLYLRREDCIRGLLVLLGIALRVLTLVEFVVRRELQAQGEALAGLYEGNPRRKTERPTTERLLRAFEGITLYRAQTGGHLVSQVTPLTPLQRRILALMGVPERIYLPPSRAGG